MSNFIVPIGNLPTISTIAEKNAAAKPAAESNIPFASFLQNAMANVVETKAASDATTYGLAMGDNDDLHTGAINSLKFSTAVSYASSVTSSVIRAYNELLKMQI